MLELHGFPMSPNTRRAQVALEEIGVEYKLVPVDLMTGAHRQPDYLALNPTARVPVLVDGDFRLWESNAILQYLAALHPEKRLDGDTPRARAEIARWMFMNAAHLSPAMAHIFAHSIRLPEDKRIPQLVENGRIEVDRCLAPLDAYLKDRSYIGASFSIADISIAASLGLAGMLGIDLGKYPNVSAWMGRIRERPSFKKVYG